MRCEGQQLEVARPNYLPRIAFLDAPSTLITPIRPENRAPIAIN